MKVHEVSSRVVAGLTLLQAGFSIVEVAPIGTNRPRPFQTSLTFS